MRLQGRISNPDVGLLQGKQSVCQCRLPRSRLAALADKYNIKDGQIIVLTEEEFPGSLLNIQSLVRTHQMIWRKQLNRSVTRRQRRAPRGNNVDVLQEQSILLACGCYTNTGLLPGLAADGRVSSANTCPFPLIMMSSILDEQLGKFPRFLGGDSYQQNCDTLER